MITGIGCDLCQISRMADLLKDTKFLQRYFAPEEQVYVMSRGVFSAASMAGCFAAKEAFVKALGMGFDGIEPRDVVVLHHQNGAPYFFLQETAEKAFKQQGSTSAHVSITHDDNLAMAFVVLESN